MKEQLTFSHMYSKLKGRQRFTTVRWLDAYYQIGKTYPVIYIVPNLFHTRQQIGEARIVKIELAKLRDLGAEFIKNDGDCTPPDFYNQLDEWYCRKKDWKGWDSEVQILTCEWTRKDR